MSSKVGIICDLGFTKSICMANYYHALCNIFNNVKIVSGTGDLEDIEVLFIGNEHFESHKTIWKDDTFINICNTKNIKVCVYSAENIHNGVYPHNVEMQRSLERFDNLYQRVLDPDDAIILNKKIARCACSKYYKDIISIPTQKLNKCVFIGYIYNHRQNLIEELKQTIDIDVIGPIESWQEYMTTLAKYRFVLSPNSYVANCFHLKFYEALLVDSIPIHQVYDNTLEYYPIEAKYKDALYFKTGSEIPDLIKNCSIETSHNKPWLEDELVDFFKEHSII